MHRDGDSGIVGAEDEECKGETPLVGHPETKGAETGSNTEERDLGDSAGEEKVGERDSAEE